MRHLGWENVTPHHGSRTINDVNGSRMLRQYVDFLQKCRKPEILDLGPVCSNNISFFLEIVSKLHICDILPRLSLSGKKDFDAKCILSLLDYREKSLDGINIWDLPDHIGSRALPLIVQKLCSFLKPHGALVMIASNTSKLQPHPLYFAIRDPGAVILQYCASCKVSYVHRSNRDIEYCMAPLRQVNSFICSNGIREFFFKL
jgi:hypothetical protein